MLQAVNTDFLTISPFLTKAHNSVKIYYFLYKLTSKSLLKLVCGLLIFCTLGTNGLIVSCSSPSSEFSQPILQSSS